MRQLKILLAEDDELSGKVTTFYLKRFGHEVDIAKNGYEAVSKNIERKYDLILMDIQMPGMDGFEATREIRRIEKDYPKRGYTPIVAITTNPNKDECFKSGMDGYAQKPFSFDGLTTLLQEKNLI